MTLLPVPTPVITSIREGSIPLPFAMVTKSGSSTRLPSRSSYSMRWPSSLGCRASILTPPLPLPLPLPTEAAAAVATLAAAAAVAAATAAMEAAVGVPRAARAGRVAGGGTTSVRGTGCPASIHPSTVLDAAAAAAAATRDAAAAMTSAARAATASARTAAARSAAERSLTACARSAAARCVATRSASSAAAATAATFEVAAGLKVCGGAMMDLIVASADGIIFSWCRQVGQVGSVNFFFMAPAVISRSSSLYLSASCQEVSSHSSRHSWQKACEHFRIRRNSSPVSKSEVQMVHSVQELFESSSNFKSFVCPLTNTLSKVTRSCRRFAATTSFCFSLRFLASWSLM
mmetsp:Transcript_23000/g.58408  ORF Transcript_23000/g.58408 Transcript_23000/m.58408 type:complete len:347 (-) Transcript_23000:954-1994(-)